MNINKETLLLYAVTDRHWLNGRMLEEDVRKCLEGGVTLLQLREKNLDKNKFLEEAITLRSICHEYNVPLIINDDVDIAVLSDADGVHVGQGDMKASDARSKLGPDKIIGVSAHNVEEALLAQQQGADYLGAGAVFSTGTKKDAGNMSFETLCDICRSVSIPVAAIGGITADNMQMLKGSGVSGIAVVSAVFAQKNIVEAAKKLKQISLEVLRS